MHREHRGNMHELLRDRGLYTVRGYTLDISYTEDENQKPALNTVCIFCHSSRPLSIRVLFG